MHRFFVPPECIDGDEAVVTGAAARQLATVLRVAPGDRIALLDDTGAEYLVTLSRVGPKEVVGAVTGRAVDAEAPSAPITLYQALLKADRFEQVLQKCTELGVARFVPVVTERCVPRVDERWAANRYRRWRRIVTEAAEQSGRRRVPALEAAVGLKEACGAAEGVRLIPWEKRASHGHQGGAEGGGPGGGARRRQRLRGPGGRPDGGRDRRRRVARRRVGQPGPARAPVRDGGDGGGRRHTVRARRARRLSPGGPLDTRR